MDRPSPILSNRARWLVRLRWFACAGVVAVVWVTSSPWRIVPSPGPLYLIAAAMVAYNAAFGLIDRYRRAKSEARRTAAWLPLPLRQA